MLTFDYIEDMATGASTSWCSSWRPGIRLIDCIPSSFDRTGGTGIIEVNGRRLGGTEAQFYHLQDGDRVAFASVPQGPLISIVAGLLTGGAAAVAAAPVSSFILGALVVGGVVSQLLRSIPGPPGVLDDSSPSRDFEGIQNSSGPGRVIPIVYGETRLGGHIIESFTEVQYDARDENNDDILIVEQGDLKDPVFRPLHTRIALCHGPVESITALEIDENPVANYEGTMWQVVLGTQEQIVLDGFAETKTTQVVQTTVTQAGGGVTETMNTAARTVEVELYFPSGLRQIDANGKLIQRDVEVKFLYRPSSGGGYTTFATRTISGATSAPKYAYARFPVLAPDAYDIRVERVTADNVDPTIQDEFRFESLIVVDMGSRAHPGIAQVGVRQVPIEKSPVPRGYTVLVKGFNDIRIYSDPATYTTGWTDNPAWCCAHFITSRRYGLGKFYDYGDIDLPSFVRWAEHCDEIVPNGRGTGGHKRCTFNLAIDARRRAAEIIQYFASVSDAFVVERGGTWFAILNDPSPMVTVINEGSYVLDSLTYSFARIEDRSTRISANYVNSENGYKRDLFIQEDPNIDAGEHLEDTLVTLWGADRSAQVARVLTRALNASRLETRAVEFVAGLDALKLQIGDVFGLATATGAIGVANGRILSVSADRRVIELDSEVTLDTAKTYEIVVTHALDGMTSQKWLANVSADTTNFIEVSNTNWARDVQRGDKYSVGEVGFAVEKFRCIRKALRDNFTSQISAALYDVDAFDETITSVPTDSEAFTNPRVVPADISDLTLTHRQPKDSAGNTIDVIDVDWNAPTAGTVFGYVILFRKQGAGAYRRVGDTKNTTHFTIREELESSTTYEVQVLTVGLFLAGHPKVQGGTVTT